MFLQSTIKATTNKKKDKKKKNKALQDDEEDEIADGDAPAAKGPVQMTAEELADEEWGPVKDKKKKDKKGKKKSNAVDDDEEPEAPKGATRSCALPFQSSLTLYSRNRRSYTTKSFNPSTTG